jgi:hypothetical protein
MGKVRATWLVITLISLPLAFIVACIIAFYSNCTHEARTARYGQVLFQGQSGQYGYVQSRQPDDWELYIEIPGEGRFHIGAIPQEILDRRFEKSPLSDHYSGHGDGWNLSLWYENGQLQQFLGSPYSISREPNGKPLSFPIRYEELDAVWGKADSVNSRREQNHIRFN